MVQKLCFVMLRDCFSHLEDVICKFDGGIANKGKNVSIKYNGIVFIAVAQREVNQQPAANSCNVV